MVAEKGVEIKYVTDIWSVVGVHYRLYPGGVCCEITYHDDTGFETAEAFIQASMDETECYDRHKLAGEALEKAIEGMNSQLSALNDAIEKRDSEQEEELTAADREICECGDPRNSHAEGTGRCYLCSWNPVVPGDPCLEFRLFDKSEVSPIAPKG